jgi:hypothetical protein
MMINIILNGVGLRYIDDFNKENIKFDKKGEHFDYFESFFGETFYNQKDIRLNHP